MTIKIKIENCDTISDLSNALFKIRFDLRAQGRRLKLDPFKAALPPQSISFETPGYYRHKHKIKISK